MLVSHIIPCLNYGNMTDLCVQTLLKNTSLESEIIIIDDGSEGAYHNNSADLILRHKENKGFPVSVNNGIKLARGDYIAIWNNDLFVAPNWLPPLIEALENDKDLGMASSVLKEPCHMTKSDFFNQYTKEWSMSQIPRIEPWAKGCPWVFKREIFYRVGLFDERYIVTQYEDSDMLLRMALKGIKHATISNSLAYHLSAFTQNNVLKEKYDGFQYAADNRRRFEEKWGTCDIDYAKAFETRRYYKC